MSPSKRRFQDWWLLAADLLSVTAAFVTAYFIRFGEDYTNLLSLPLQFEVFLLIMVLAWTVVGLRFRLYATGSLVLLSSECWQVLKTALCSVMIATVPAFLFRENPLSRLFLLYMFGLLTLSTLGIRFLIRMLPKYLRLRGYRYRQVVIVGKNKRSQQIASSILNSPGLGIRILDVIDHDPEASPSADGMCRLDRSNGIISDLERILRSHVVDEVIVTLPMKSFYSHIEQILAICEQAGVEVKISTDLFKTHHAKRGIIALEGMNFLEFYNGPGRDWKMIAKRAMDVSISTALILLLAPLLMLTAALIKLDSRGPVFFVQERIGYHGRRFRCYKFRSMVDNAERLKSDLMPHNEMTGPVFKMRNDPRVTRLGRILRKTSIDELPQLFNVLIGDMSLVGPRPPVPGEVSEYGLGDRRRLSIRPGITCIWQVNGRNAIPFEHWVELDRQYIDNWSLWLDLKILAKTIPAVLRGGGV
jgi:exopolysaccharide biosynthesis polyprenyl glycosylphosphotransferase